MGTRPRKLLFWIKMDTKNQDRRIVTSFSLRLDLLERLEKEVPKGDRSAFLEKLLRNELERPAIRT